jgi:hypothetical protein
MVDESTKQAAQEYLAARLSEEGQSYENQVNTEAAVALAPAVLRKFAHNVIAQCHEWNAVTKEQTLTCKETVLGDLRILCSGKSQQIIVHYDSRKRLITIKNSARPEHEKDTILSIEGYSTGSGREAHLVRNNQPVNPDMLILGHLRMLAGLGRRAEG